MKQRALLIRARFRRYPDDRWIVAADAWAGTALLLPSANRESSPTFAIVRVLPVRVWGGVFLFLAVLLLAALILRHVALQTGRGRWASLYLNIADASRIIGPTVYVAWTAAFFIAAVFNSNASLFGAGAFGYMAYRHSYAPVPGNGKE